ncbi:MAG: DMT family transporter [Bifidobacterium psychraerophilum]|uniref:DMT family transporter n=2 Tax=Bifidobacterium psychraerophilum TaxID=218140 RepID=UPI0023F9FA32|nr:DMT family transporter [Bifidobacterium psychraerophilum]MCI2181150.1 DMT family transporter [Bifidobacterium psychraerophilum]
MGTAEPELMRLSPWTARGMLVIAAAAWGGGYTFSKIALESLSVQWMMSCRLCLSTLIMVALLWRRIRRTHLPHLIVPGVLLGVSYWAAFMFQMRGLEVTEPGRNAFLTATYCVFVPFLVWIVTRQRPAARHILAALICLFGVGFIAIPKLGEGLSLGQGDVLSLIGAVLFAGNLVLSGMFAKKFDMLMLTLIEFLTAAMLFTSGALITDPLPGAGDFTWTTSASLAYLIIASTLIAQNFQNLAFSKVPAAQGSLILCTESLFGLLFSVLLVHEQVTATSFVGFALIFLAIVLSEIRLRRRPRTPRPMTGPRADVL